MALAVAMLYGCGGSGVRNNDTKGDATVAQEPAQPVFRPAQAPGMSTPEQQLLYLNEHYWDTFDFADTLFIAKVDTTQMLSAFAFYTQQFVPDSLVSKSMSRLIKKASVSKPMLEYFMMLAETVLHDPNSQLRNDELYIPVLETLLESDLYDKYEKMPYEYDLEIARQNRIGRKANDFRYTLLSGSAGRMYDIKADYLLLFISNPGCPMCREVREQIKASQMITKMVEEGTMKILVIYPDEDLKAWREHLPEYPESWINGYDYGCEIDKQRLYDLKAIPSLYLLDADKRVMAKDCVDVGYIEYLISTAESR